MFNPKLISQQFDLNPSQKFIAQVSFDLLIILFAIMLAIIIQIADHEELSFADYHSTIIITVVIGFFSCFTFEIYKSSLRHLTIEHSFKIAMACTITSLVFYFSLTYFKLDYALQISILYFNFAFIGLTITRYLIRDIIHKVQFDNRKKVAVYGAGQGGIQLISALKFHPEYTVNAIIDDNANLQGQYLSGLKILSFEQAVKKILNENIEIVLMALPSLGNNQKANLIQKLTDFSIPVKTIPDLDDLIKGSAKISDLKDININDLLGRTTIKPIDELMSKNIMGKVILITGAGGSIGSELCRQILIWKPKEVILLDNSEFNIYKIYSELSENKHKNHIKVTPIIGSIQDPDLIRTIFETFKINTVYHAAAYKHVPIIEQNLIQGIKNNVFGTHKLIDISISEKVENFILVSTDKAVNPTNYMGASKRIAELICQSRNKTSKDTCFTIVRFGNVLGSSGSVIPLFQKQIKERGPVTLTHLDVERYFMTIHEAAQLVIQAGSISNGGETYVLDMGKPVKIIDLAFHLIKIAGLRPYMKEQFGTGSQVEGDIEVKIIGLRPGEKLYEELSYGDNLTKTVHPKIMVSPEIPISEIKINALLSNLKDAIQQSNYDEIFKTFQNITPGLSFHNESTDILYNHKIKE